jgi:hypothetical protein
MARVYNALHSVYTVADGDGQTTVAREADVDVGRDPRPSAQCRASLLHPTARCFVRESQRDFDAVPLALTEKSICGSRINLVE